MLHLTKWLRLGARSIPFVLHYRPEVGWYVISIHDRGVTLWPFQPWILRSEQEWTLAQVQVNGCTWEIVRALRLTPELRSGPGKRIVFRSVVDHPQQEQKAA